MPSANFKSGKAIHHRIITLMRIGFKSFMAFLGDVDVISSVGIQKDVIE